MGNPIGLSVAYKHLGRVRCLGTAEKLGAALSLTHLGTLDSPCSWLGDLHTLTQVGVFHLLVLWPSAAAWGQQQLQGALTHVAFDLLIIPIS